MSGIALQYPFKPNDLSDDLESFVHVICHNAVRFHRHNMTRGEVTHTLDTESLKEINRGNEQLARWVSNMYYESSGGDVLVFPRIAWE